MGQLLLLRSLFLFHCASPRPNEKTRWPSESQSRLEELNANGRLTAANIPHHTTPAAPGVGGGAGRGWGWDWGNSTFIKLYCRQTTDCSAAAEENRLDQNGHIAHAEAFEPLVLSLEVIDSTSESECRSVLIFAQNERMKPPKVSH